MKFLSVCNNNWKLNEYNYKIRLIFFYLKNLYLKLKKKNDLVIRKITLKNNNKNK